LTWLKAEFLGLRDKIGDDSAEAFRTGHSYRTSSWLRDGRRMAIR
jgi:hypothetical protein